MSCAPRTCIGLMVCTLILICAPAAHADALHGLRLFLTPEQRQATTQGSPVTEAAAWIRPANVDATNASPNTPDAESSHPQRGRATVSGRRGVQTIIGGVPSRSLP